MTTETKTEKKPTEVESTTQDTAQNKTPTTDNKTLFGPLGKYAVIAVIMVSIIVTSAIMLNKQLNTVEEQIATIESGVSGSQPVATNSAASTSNETVAAEAATTETIAAKAEEAQVTIESASSDTTPVAETTVTEAAVIKTSATETTAAIDNQTPVQVRRSKPGMDNQARISAHKAEQKQRMSEMFARIKTFEAQQLNQYKANQDKRVERLRAQIAQQQKVIDALILRNKESLKFREASMQKHQTSREQMLNRI